MNPILPSSEREEEKEEPYIACVEDIAVLETLIQDTSEGDILEIEITTGVGIAPQMESLSSASHDDCIPKTAKIEIVLALPSPQTSVQLFLLNQERIISLLYLPIASRIRTGPEYDVRCFLADDWYKLVPELEKRKPHLIIFPYNSQSNCLFVDTMRIPARHLSSGRKPFQSALDVCTEIYGQKKNSEDYPWLCLFGEEEINLGILQKSGIKKHFLTTDPEILSRELSNLSNEIFYRELRRTRNEYFGSY